jgi:hypothetical protein
MTTKIKEKKSLIETDASIEFIFNHAIKYFNVFITHSRYILEVFFRLGLFFLIDANPFNIGIIIVGSSLCVAGLIFFITKRIKNAEIAEREGLNPDAVLLPDNVLDELKQIRYSLENSQRTERTYINSITGFMDVNMLCTFSFLVLQTYFTINQNIIIMVFIGSCIISSILHYQYFANAMEAEDKDIQDYLHKICEKAKATEIRKDFKAFKPEPGFFLLIVDSLFYTGAIIACLISLPDNVVDLLINLVASHIWMIGIPLTILIAVCLYTSPKFKNVAFAFISTFSTISTLSLMGFKYISLFPIINQILFLRVGPLMLFKTTCVYFGVLTGLISHRAFNRSLKITTLLEQHENSEDAFPKGRSLATMDSIDKPGDKSGEKRPEDDVAYHENIRNGSPANGSHTNRD